MVLNEQKPDFLYAKFLYPAPSGRRCWRISGLVLSGVKILHKQIVFLGFKSDFHCVLHYLKVEFVGITQPLKDNFQGFVIKLTREQYLLLGLVLYFKAYAIPVFQCPDSFPKGSLLKDKQFFGP